MHQLGSELLVSLLFALAGLIALIALPVALVLTLGLNRLFRSRVGRSMRATGRAIVPPERHQPFVNGPHGELTIALIPATPAQAKDARGIPLLAKMRRQARRLAAIYAAAASLYSVLLAAAVFVAIDFSTTRAVILVFALLYSLRVLQLGTPVVLAPTAVLTRQPHFLMLAVLALVVAIWVWERTIGADPGRVWLMLAGVPTVAVLLLNTRHLRAIGPIVFAATLLVLYGFGIGVAYATLYAWDAIGPVRFVREDLAPLPVAVAVTKYFAGLLSLPLDQMRDELSRLISTPLSVVHVANPDGLTAVIWRRLFGIWLAATAIGVATAWAFVRWLARRYHARRASDQMLSIDVLMLIFTVWVLLVFSASNTWMIAASALMGFMGYKLCTQWSLRHRRVPALLGTPRALLLLRVFGFDRRTQRLLEDLGHRWRYLGPIRLIGGTDLADVTIEPHEFFEFLNGRLSRAFVTGSDDLESRIAEHTTTPDPDGLFRIEDFFCHEATWRMTVARLARGADAVLMDLRGFTPTNRGCIFEITQLIASVSLHRIVLLVDGSTDVACLEQTLQDAWRMMPGDSPNVGAGKHRLHILQASANYGRTLDSLLGLLCESFRARANPEDMFEWQVDPARNT